jgi:hypothetical protein
VKRLEEKVEAACLISFEAVRRLVMLRRDDWSVIFFLFFSFWVLLTRRGSSWGGGGGVGDGLVSSRDGNGGGD